MHLVASQSICGWRVEVPRATITMLPVLATSLMSFFILVRWLIQHAKNQALLVACNLPTVSLWRSFTPSMFASWWESYRTYTATPTHPALACLFYRVYIQGASFSNMSSRKTKYSKLTNIGWETSCIGTQAFICQVPYPTFCTETRFPAIFLVYFGGYPFPLSPQSLPRATVFSAELPRGPSLPSHFRVGCSQEQGSFKAFDYWSDAEVTKAINPTAPEPPQLQVNHSYGYYWWNSRPQFLMDKAYCILHFISQLAFPELGLFPLPSPPHPWDYSQGCLTVCMCLKGRNTHRSPEVHRISIPDCPPSHGRGTWSVASLHGCFHQHPGSVWHLRF